MANVNYCLIFIFLSLLQCSCLLSRPASASAYHQLDPQQVLSSSHSLHRFVKTSDNPLVRNRRNTLFKVYNHNHNHNPVAHNTILASTQSNEPCHKNDTVSDRHSCSGLVRPSPYEIIVKKNGKFLISMTVLLSFLGLVLFQHQSLVITGLVKDSILSLFLIVETMLWLKVWAIIVQLGWMSSTLTRKIIHTLSAPLFMFHWPFFEQFETTSSEFKWQRLIVSIVPFLQIVK
jgi:hypothetical protein